MFLGDAHCTAWGMHALCYMSLIINLFFVSFLFYFGCKDTNIYPFFEIWDGVLLKKSGISSGWTMCDRRLVMRVWAGWCLAMIRRRNFCSRKGKDYGVLWVF